jgi:thymidylate synthase
MAYIDREYHKLLNAIKRDGYTYEDPNREGVFRTEITSFTIRHLFKNGFPLISTRELNYNNIIVELLWFLKGDTNIKYLVDRGCNIWNKDAYKYYLKKGGHASEKMFKTLVSQQDEFDSRIKDYKYGDLGPVYGRQWRNFNGVDQIAKLIKGLKEKPLGTEHIVNSWNPADIPDMALPPCHYGFQVVVRPLTVSERFHATPGANLKDVDVFVENAHIIYLDGIGAPKYGFELHWEQRSVDTFLGLPYNIASYASLALILEKITGHVALGIQGNLKKVHLYDNSLNAVAQQLKNDQYLNDECKLVFPEDEVNPDGLDFNLRMGYLRGNLSLNDFIEEMKPEWFSIEGYSPYPSINVPMLAKD